MTARRGSVADRRAADYGRGVVRRIVLVFAAVLLVAGVLPLTLLVLLRSRAVSPVGHAALLDGFALALIAAMLIASRRVERVLQRRVRGNDGELHVGEILEGMAGDGWFALQDIDTGAGNVDHVVIGPGGVFTLETKSHRGPVRVARVERLWLRQAYAESKRIEALAGVRTQPLLVFSRAYLDRAPSRQRGVLLLPARMLAGHLRRRRPVLTVDEARAVYARLIERLDELGC